jgi:hypothetical protein
MEEAPEWLEEHADDLREEGTTEEDDDVTLLVDTKVEEEIGLPVDPMPPTPPRRAIPGVGLGSVGTGRRQHTFPSTSSSSLTNLRWSIWSSWSFHSKLIWSTSTTTYCFQRKIGALYR